ncbi:carbohydrate-binding protein [Mariniflexile ostreae]|uniref:Carbohydrate-binding protein n=2 Tax=Mariniflexile ostreae TaxID=1520892 RepID=A0ABV5FBD9_9FLAO
MALIFFSFLSCEDDIREVTLYEKGTLEAKTSSTSINVGEVVSFENLSTKVQSLTWTFEGGNPATSFNPKVEVTYNQSGVYKTTLEVKYIDNQIEKEDYFVEVSPLAVEPQSPYGGSPKVTETKIQFEDFDFGGEGISYHDTEPENKGDAHYRFGHGVDIKTTLDEEGKYDVTSIQNGEWLEYSVFVETASVYDFNFRLLADDSGSSIKIQDVNGGTVTDLGSTGLIESTDSAYKTIKAENITLSAGQHVIRILFSGNGIDANYFEIINTVYVPPVQKFGIYTENTDLIGSVNVQLEVNNQFAINTITDNPYEGSKALSFTIDGTADWAMASIIPDSPIDISSYATYNVALKSTSNGTILIRLQSGGGQKAILTFDAASEPYGFKRDGNWHFLSIPIADFVAKNPAINLNAITELLVFRSSPDDVRNANNYNFYLDNFYLSK